MQDTKLEDTARPLNDLQQETISETLDRELENRVIDLIKQTIYPYINMILECENECAENLANLVGNDDIKINLSATDLLQLEHYLFKYPGHQIFEAINGYPLKDEIRTEMPQFLSQLASGIKHTLIQRISQLACLVK